ncbi:major facilitator superfamily domain-containing protein [Aspergillus floccosus]
MPIQFMKSTLVSFPRQNCTPSRQPLLLKERSSVPFIIFVVSFAIFTDTFLYGLVVPVLPNALNERVHISSSDEQKWTSILLALYAGGTFIFGPITGCLSDQFKSRWWPMIAGALVQGTGTALLCTGTSIGLWIAGRILQGAATSVIWTVANALLVDTVGDERIGHAMGYVGASMSIGTLAGPLVGGAVYEHAGYYTVFAVAFAVIGVDVVLRLVVIEKKDASRYLNPSAHSAELPTGSNPKCADNKVSSIELEPTDETQPQHRPSPHTTLAAAYTLLCSPRTLVALWGTIVKSINGSAWNSVLPLFVRDAYGWAQTAQGLIFIPFILPYILSPLVGCVNDRNPRMRRFLGAGSLLLSVPAWVLLRLVSVNDIGHKVLLCALLAWLGFCMTILSPLVLAEASYAATEKAKQEPSKSGEQGPIGLAYGFENSAFAVGSIAGPFLAGSVRETAGWDTMTWVLGLLNGVSAIPVLLMLGGLRIPWMDDERRVS